MTPIRLAEIAGASTVAFATATAATVEGGLAEGWFKVLVPMGVAALTGYFSARITTERSIATLEAKVDALGDELRNYYQRRGAGARGQS